MGVERNEERVVVIDYTNHRGQRGLRRVTPQRIYFGEVEWHPGEQWLMSAYVHDREAMRTIAMADIHSWVSVNDDQKGNDES